MAKKKKLKKKEKEAMNRKEFKEVVLEMLERLNDSDLLDDDDQAEFDDSMIADKLADVFCDAVELIDSNDRSNELDDDVVDLYEGEPWLSWGEIEDEPEEEEPEEEEPEEEEPEEEEPEPVKSKKKTKKVKKETKKKETKKAPAKKKETKKAPAKKKETSKTKEKDEYGFGVGTIANQFAKAIKNKPMTMDEVKEQDWNVNGNQQHGYFKKLKDLGVAAKHADGRMYIIESKAGKKLTSSNKKSKSKKKK